MDITHVLCTECKGEKYTGYKDNKRFKSRLICHKCHGQGTIDWVHNILNKNRVEHDVWEIYYHHDEPKRSSIISMELTL